MKSRVADPQKHYWRGLEDLIESPGLVQSPGEGADEAPPSEISRRNFLGIMGAAFAMSGVVGCSRPVTKILPYAKMPEDLVPGLPQQYATAWDWRGFGESLLATSYEGRPTKIEGNPEHPVNRGKTDVFTQASILGLYDPDRSQHVLHNGEESTWDAFQAWLGDHLESLEKKRGKGLVFLSGYSSSALTDHLKRAVLSAYPRAAWHTYEAVDRNNVIEGAHIAFGKAVRTHIDYSQADVILSLDCDFLGSEANMVAAARGFAQGRRIQQPSDDMSRLYAVEPMFTVTGASADHRLAVGYQAVGDVARGVAEGVGINLPTTGHDPENHDPFIKAAAEDLLAHKGRAVVVVGRSQPDYVHALGHAINAALGAVGPIIRYTEEPLAKSSLVDLEKDLRADSVDTLVILGTNPAYDAPGDLAMVEAFGRAGHVIHLGLECNETGIRAEWHLPQSHYLEAWGDARAFDGTVSVVQPLIAPLYDTKSLPELLSCFLGRRPDKTAGFTDLRAFYAAGWGEVDRVWRKALHDGLVGESAFDEAFVSLRTRSILQSIPQGRPVTNGLELIFKECPKVYDGRFANNAWLQELPDPITKLTWDNVIHISPAKARELGVATGDVATLTVREATVTGPVWVQPGHAAESVTVYLGYGRRKSGRVGTDVGFNANLIRPHALRDSVWGVGLSRTGDTYPLAGTQHHWTLEGRPHIREASLDHYREHPNFAEHLEEGAEPDKTLYTDREYDFEGGLQWGMTIDLNTCTGCNACVVGCQSENNISTVGKDQVMRGREMQWIRLDRYFEGNEEDPHSIQQPVPCQQCENAPCESVCPVAATSHNSEGLNDMVYNRCIGTRYCANNCPYKVRRFNFYDYNTEMPEVEKMQKNPNVTVRMRGVMEKCTFCVQRINREKINAKINHRELADGDIVTACQQVCPTSAITFGNISDPDSAVSKEKAQDRDYTLLSWVNTQPRTSYLAKIRNPNPMLEPHS